MKILQIIPNLNVGGAEIFTVSLANELSKTHDVTICTYFDKNEHDLLYTKVDENVKLVSLSKKLGFDFSFLMRLHLFIMKNNFDIVHVHGFAIKNLFFSLFISRKIKLIYTNHSLPQQEFKSPFLRRILNQFLKYRIKYCVAISDIIFTELKKEYGTSNIIQINIGVNEPKSTPLNENVKKEIESFKINPYTSIFCYIGRIAKEKNLHLLIESFNELHKTDVNVSLFLVGEESPNDKGLRVELERLAAANIHFIGFRSNIGDYLEYSDAICLTSFFEGLPLTLLEAASKRVVPISTNVGGVGNVIQHMKTGILVDNLQAADFAKAISDYLSLTPSEKEQLRENAFKHYLHNFSLINCSKSYSDLYLNCINNPNI